MSKSTSEEGSQEKEASPSAMSSQIQIVREYQQQKSLLKLPSLKVERSRSSCQKSRFTDHFITQTLLALSTSSKTMKVSIFCQSYVLIKLSTSSSDEERDFMNLKFNVTLCKLLLLSSIYTLIESFTET